MSIGIIDKQGLTEQDWDELQQYVREHSNPPDADLDGLDQEDTREPILNHENLI